MMQLDMLVYKFESTHKCKVDKAQNGFEALESVLAKFNSEP